MTNFELRKWQTSDLDSLVKHANNINVAKFLTNQFPHPYTKTDGERFLETSMSHNPVKIFAIVVEGEAVGAIGVFPQDDIHCLNAEMGYWLSEEFWGRGIVTEAIRRTVEYCFETFPVGRIFARPFGNNPASQRILEKAGFRLEARFDKILMKNGELLDEMVYAIRRN
ncbi:MAG: N-acetyltransferase [Bacteroidetes bacterium HGW-Bacteroidetes-11]|jgi:RimJ/RimL family protein N-acetyltransferase|nr:MAG: N-acetyltransferase [Bacteroidetes bacterium HGW-Bacteroidetes-11]